jgi:hypothetical protein
LQTIVNFVLRQLRGELPSVEFTLTAGTKMPQLFDTATANDCADARPGTVADLANILHDNPRYAGDPHYNQIHEKLLAAITIAFATSMRMPMATRNIGLPKGPAAPPLMKVRVES